MKTGEILMMNRCGEGALYHFFAEVYFPIWIMLEQLEFQVTKDNDLLFLWILVNGSYVQIGEIQV